MEPKVIQLDIRKIPLTEFMKALGQEHPVVADGNLRIYNAPYAAKSEPTMVSTPKQTSGVIQSPVHTAEYMTLHTR